MNLSKVSLGPLKILFLAMFLLAVPSYAKLTPLKPAEATQTSEAYKFKKLCGEVMNYERGAVPTHLQDLRFNCSGLDFTISDADRALKFYRKGKLSEEELIQRYLILDKEKGLNEKKLFYDGVALLKEIIEVDDSTLSKSYCNKTYEKFISQNNSLRKHLIPYLPKNNKLYELPPSEPVHFQNVSKEVVIAFEKVHKHHLLLNLHSDILENLQQKCEVFF